jgi:type IV pilus assembly protein PilV
MRSKPTVKSKEGFTLIEIMIALVVLSIGLIALAGLQMSAIRGNTLSKRMTTAVSIANARIEQIKNMPYANIQSESSTQVTESNMTFTRQVTVSNDIPVADTKTVNVTVTWKNGAKSHTVPISTVITQ